MDLTVEEYLEGLLSQEALDKPADSSPPKALDFRLPDDFDEKKFNQGRNFYWKNSFAMGTSMLLGLVAVFAVPSILRVLVSTRKSNSSYTAYRRYVSTMLHTISWFETELKPGSKSWRSLFVVRTRHAKAGMAAKLKGLGVVSHRDIALTQFGFVGFAVLKADKFGIRQIDAGDWEAYIYTWRVIGQMLGLEDRYNICRKTYDETYQVCRALMDRVYTPALENVPEYFEHAARVMLDGMWAVNPALDSESMIYVCKYLAEVPGFVYTEDDRSNFQRRLRELLRGKPADTGVDSTQLMSKPAIEGLPSLPPRLHYLKDYDIVETVPSYKVLSFKAKYKLALGHVQATLYTFYIFRMYFNINYLISLFFAKYFPYLAFFKFGIKNAFVNIFQEDVSDDTPLLPNAEYYKAKPEEPWYKKIIGSLWG